MVDIGNGRLHADVRGTGGPVVVLEAGIAASSISWALVRDRIAAFTTVVSYDRAGFGWSRDSAPHRPTALAAAQDLAGLLERLNVTAPFILVGHSYGGLIARIFQQNFPARVGGLVLLDPVSRTEWARPSPRLKKVLARGVALSKRGAMLAHIGVVGMGLKILLSGSRVVPKLLARASAAGDGSGVTERLTGEMSKLPREVWPAVATHWSEARCFHAMADSLEKLPISAKQVQEHQPLGDLPVIVFSAPTSDRVVIEEHEREARLSTRGKHIMLAGGGHWVQLDAPDAVVEAVRRVCGLAR